MQTNRTVSVDRIGKGQRLSSSFEVAEAFRAASQSDEQAAAALRAAGLYNQAAYFYIQSMEKLVKHYIASWIDVTNTDFADELRKTISHSVQGAIDLLVAIYAGGNDLLGQQIASEINKTLGNVRFDRLHNDVRYAYYRKSSGDYVQVACGDADCRRLAAKLEALRRFLVDMDRFR